MSIILVRFCSKSPRPDLRFAVFPFYWPPHNAGLKSTVFDGVTCPFIACHFGRKSTGAHPLPRPPRQRQFTGVNEPMDP